MCLMCVRGGVVSLSVLVCCRCVAASSLQLAGCRDHIQDVSPPCRSCIHSETVAAALRLCVLLSPPTVARRAACGLRLWRGIQQSRRHRNSGAIAIASLWQGREACKLLSTAFSNHQLVEKELRWLVNIYCAAVWIGLGFLRSRFRQWCNISVSVRRRPQRVRCWGAPLEGWGGALDGERLGQKEGQEVAGMAGAWPACGMVVVEVELLDLCACVLVCVTRMYLNGYCKAQQVVYYTR